MFVYFKISFVQYFIFLLKIYIHTPFRQYYARLNIIILYIVIIFKLCILKKIQNYKILYLFIPIFSFFCIFCLAILNFSLFFSVFYLYFILLYTLLRLWLTDLDMMFLYIRIVFLLIFQ